MSGDVQPRKRKDKKRKKDELGAEEPRGTAATLGEGDVFLHSHHDHGTGGHWCAKVIFFSLLAVLVTLIGLIILENRGLSELEANSVESRYSGMLEGWLEDAPDDDHHDKHTLELNHHDDDDEDDHYIVHQYNDEHEEEKDTHEDDENDEVNSEENGEEDGDANSEETDEDDDAVHEMNEDDDDTYSEENDDDDANHEENENDDDANSQENEDDDNQQSEENEDDIYEDENNELEQDVDDNDEENEENFDSQELEENDDNDDETNEEEQGYDEDNDEHDTEEADEDDEVEVEKIEQEASEEEPISTELPALPEEDDDDDTKDDDDDEADGLSHEAPDDAEEDDDNRDNDEDDDFLEADDEPVERITAPSGKPFKEVEEYDVSTEKPPDTLEEEEEYEKLQEEKRREEEKSSHMWLKLAVGGALLVATHAVVRRASAPRDEAEEERVTREATPIDRRMTLIPEEPVESVLTKKMSQGTERPVTEEFRTVTEKASASPVLKQDSDEEELEEPEEIDEEIEEIEEPVKEAEKKDDKEAFSDEEVEEEEEEEIVVLKKETPRVRTPAPEPEPTPEPAVEAKPQIEDDDVADDVEIIEDEQLEEELEEEEDDDDISDVDDTDLLSRLEAKYGRLPEPERPGQKHKDGGNSVEDDWPGEPVEAYWRQQLDNLEQELRQGDWSAVIQGASAPQLQSSGRARYLLAAALDKQAEAKRDNRLLTRAITAYLEVLKQSDSLSDKKLLDIATRTLNRIQFRGNYLNAEPVYRLLIRRFPDEPAYRNNLTVSFLMANRADLAGQVLKETLALWPDDRVALAHHGFVLKTQYNKLEEAVDAFEKALKGDKGPACEPRFYYHYGDALLLLGRYKEAHEVHKRGAKYGHFLSPAQRSLYNVNRLKGQPWWEVNDTPYSKLAKALEASWKEILKEGEAAKALYEKEKEGLKERGEWSQMDLFVRGQEIPGRCKRAPVTCSIVRAEPSAATCRRGQIKFSAMEAGTHVRPHVGPTNCRLRMHLGLTNTKDTYIRVDKETRQWQEGKVLIFDDSFEHEVWHNGTGKRLVLIVDVWHPELTQAERRSLPAI